MSLRLRTADIHSITNRPLFFDANVLLYLFAGTISQSSSWASATYASIFKKSIQLQCSLFTDVIVLSEFINRFLRIEYENHLKKNNLSRQNLNFKNFRATPDGKAVCHDVELIVKDKILKQFNILNTAFDANDIASMSLSNSDFSDQLITQTCIKNNCVLITNDADFSGSPLDILTENKKLT